MTPCTRELLLSRALDDAELLAHLQVCSACAEAHGRLTELLPAFHDELTRFQPHPLPTPRTRFSMPALSTVLLAAASIGVITLAATQAPPQQPRTVQMATPRIDAKRADEVSTIPWNALSEKEWQALAEELLPTARQIVQHTIGGKDSLKVLIQTGRAAENANRPGPPFYGERDGKPVNVYFYEASRLVQREPALLEEVTNPELRNVVTNLLERHP